jgi:phosphohistidine phosphatase SixA
LESLHENADVSGFVEEFAGIAEGHKLVMAVSHMPIVYGIANTCGYQYSDAVQNASGIVIDVDPKAPCELRFVQTIAPEFP